MAAPLGLEAVVEQLEGAVEWSRPNFMTVDSLPDPVKKNELLSLVAVRYAGTLGQATQVLRQLLGEMDTSRATAGSFASDADSDDLAAVVTFLRSVIEPSLGDSTGRGVLRQMEATLTSLAGALGGTLGPTTFMKTLSLPLTALVDMIGGRLATALIGTRLVWDYVAKAGGPVTMTVRSPTRLPASAVVTLQLDQVNALLGASFVAPGTGQPLQRMGYEALLRAQGTRNPAASPHPLQTIADSVNALLRLDVGRELGIQAARKTTTWNKMPEDSRRVDLARRINDGLAQSVRPDALTDGQNAPVDQTGWRQSVNNDVPLFLLQAMRGLESTVVELAQRGWAAQRWQPGVPTVILAASDVQALLTALGEAHDRIYLLLGQRGTAQTALAAALAVLADYTAAVREMGSQFGAAQVTLDTFLNQTTAAVLSMTTAYESTMMSVQRLNPQARTRDDFRQAVERAADNLADLQRRLTDERKDRDRLVAVASETAQATAQAEVTRLQTAHRQELESKRLEHVAALQAAFGKDGAAREKERADLNKALEAARKEASEARRLLETARAEGDRQVQTTELAASQQMVQLKNELADMQRQRDTLKDSLVACKDELKAANQEVKSLRGQDAVRDLTREVQDLRTTNARLEVELEDILKTSDDRELIKTLQANQLDAETRVDQAQERLSQAAEELARLRDALVAADQERAREQEQLQGQLKQATIDNARLVQSLAVATPLAGNAADVDDGNQAELMELREAARQLAAIQQDLALTREVELRQLRQLLAPGGSGLSSGAPSPYVRSPVGTPVDDGERVLRAIESVPPANRTALEMPQAAAATFVAPPLSPEAYGGLTPQDVMSLREHAGQLDSVAAQATVVINQLVDFDEGRSMVANAASGTGARLNSILQALFNDRARLYDLFGSALRDLTQDGATESPDDLSPADLATRETAMRISREEEAGAVQAGAQPVPPVQRARRLAADTAIVEMMRRQLDNLLPRLTAGQRRDIWQQTSGSILPYAMMLLGEEAARVNSLLSTLPYLVPNSTVRDSTPVELLARHLQAAEEALALARQSPEANAVELQRARQQVAGASEELDRAREGILAVDRELGQALQERDELRVALAETRKEQAMARTATEAIRRSDQEQQTEEPAQPSPMAQPPPPPLLLDQEQQTEEPVPLAAESLATGTEVPALKQALLDEQNRALAAETELAAARRRLMELAEVADNGDDVAPSQALRRSSRLNGGRRVSESQTAMAGVRAARMAGPSGVRLEEAIQARERAEAALKAGDDRLAQLQTQVDNLTKELAARALTIDELKGAAGTVQTSADVALEDTLQLKSEVAGLQEQLNRARRAADDWALERQALERERASLQQRLEESQAEAAALRDALQQSQRAGAESIALMAEMETAIGQNNKAAVELQQRALTLAQQLEASDTRAKELAAGLEEAERRAGFLQQQLAETQQLLLTTQTALSEQQRGATATTGGDDEMDGGVLFGSLAEGGLDGESLADQQYRQQRLTGQVTELREELSQVRQALNREESTRLAAETLLDEGLTEVVADIFRRTPPPRGGLGSREDMRAWLKQTVRSLGSGQNLGGEARLLRTIRRDLKLRADQPLTEDDLKNYFSQR